LLPETNHGDDISIAASQRQDDSLSAASISDVEHQNAQSNQQYDEGGGNSSGDSLGGHGDDAHGGGDCYESHTPQSQPLVSDDGDAGSLDDHGHGAADHGEGHGNGFGHADNGNHGSESGDQVQTVSPSTPTPSETRTVVYITIQITPVASASSGSQARYQPKTVTRDDGTGDDPATEKYVAAESHATTPARMEITPSVDSFSAAKTVAANGNARHERDIVANEAVAATSVERVVPAAEAPVAQPQVAPPQNQATPLSAFVSGTDVAIANPADGPVQSRNAYFLANAANQSDPSADATAGGAAAALLEGATLASGAFVTIDTAALDAALQQLLAGADQVVHTVSRGLSAPSFVSWLLAAATAAAALEFRRRRKRSSRLAGAGAPLINDSTLSWVPELPGSFSEDIP
jgi:hypothetical protein